jgi:hypothetical protein
MRFLLPLAACLLLTNILSAADAAPNTLTDEEAKAGWKLLFDGKNLTGWRIYNGKGTGNWEATKDGNLSLTKPGSGDLMTEAKYGDFELSLEWKFEEGNNSGIIYRAVETKGPSYETGPEMQVTNQKPTDKLGKNDGGSLYDMYAPSANPFKEGSDWVQYRIIAKGNHIEHWVNGTKVVDCEIGSDDWNSRYAASKWKDKKDFAAAKTGHIALQDHGGKILYRNVKIRELK